MCSRPIGWTSREATSAALHQEGFTMKTGRTISELAAELERQATSKKDYIADTRKLTMREARTGEATGVVLDGVNGGMSLRPTAHGQLAASLGIPKPYYDRMLAEQPDLLSANVNRWLSAQPAKKLVRTLDNSVRAILSDSYRPLDNLDLAEAVLPQLIKLGARVESSEVTENRFYLKAVTDRIQGDIKVGDRIQAGAAISNSEVGQGSLWVNALDFRLACLNGMIRETAIRKAHLGRGARGQDAIEDAREYFRTETRAADDRAFFLKVQDATAAMFDAARFEKRLDQYREAGARMISEKADPVRVVEVTAKRFGFNDGEKSSILQHLIRGGDLSAWGLANAVTRAAQDVESYDRSTEMEALGGDVIELPASAWREIAQTATAGQSV
jgi:hypothetical protein